MSAQHSLDGTAPPQFERLVTELADLIFELRRRDGNHFERWPFTLPTATEGAQMVLHAQPACSWRELSQAVADAAGAPTREAPAEAPLDALADLVTRSLRHATEALAHALHDPAFDWRESVARLVAQRQQHHGTVQAPRFAGLPGLVHKRCHDGTAYLRVGDSGPALLLVNAFGLSLDIWHDLVKLLSERFTVLVLDETRDSIQPGLPDTYYDTADSVQRFTQGVASVLTQEAITSCHVVSWCSGAKYAIELARAMPPSIASLCLFSPSFAGITGYAGADSTYESNLHTMCKLVERMPQAAPNMAKSMMALMQKSESAAVLAEPAAAVSATLSLADKATLPWLQAPFSSAANMLQFSRQLMNFRAHQLATDDHREPLELPVMLVTGQMDNTTCSLRARDICTDLFPVLQFELRGASHYFIHQNSQLASQLLQEFVSRALQADLPHPRLVRTAATVRESVVCGEI